uniref:THAP domain-containing protein 1 n=1 Tax=Cacopsylla melanoneura TaxID=428564 RepID=A0A8D8YCT9_9HEMI
MPSSCSAYGCTNRNLPGNNLHFFKFPFRYPALVTKWTKALRRKNFKPTKQSRICSVHFLPNDYSNRQGGRHMTLKHTAVPSMFNFSAGVVNKLEKRRKASTLRSKMVNVTEKKNGNTGNRNEDSDESNIMTEDSNLDDDDDDNKVVLSWFPTL